MHKTLRHGLVLAYVCGWAAAMGACAAVGGQSMKEVNPPSAPAEPAVQAVVNARLVDGRGGPPIEDAVVLIADERIVAAGEAADVDIPAEAERVDASGLTVMPGLIDAHLHSIQDNALLRRFLGNGVTAIRDPGHPFRFYQSLHFAEDPKPRVFLTGAHLDGYPPVWPQQAVVVRDARHARQTVHDHVDNGATAIKIYFNLPLSQYGAVTDAAEQWGVPVTAHLELVDADDAIRAGLDGIEHVTSFGTALAEPEEAQRFEEAVAEDYSARRDGRFRLWASIDLDAPRVQQVIELAAERQVVLVPTLAIFERREEDDGVEDDHVEAFENMLRFVGMCHEAGVPIVVGSHTYAPHADFGWAYQREMELLVDAGLSPAEVIVAATFANARYFGIEQRLGAVEAGNFADLVLVEGDPTQDVAAMYEVRGVMLNGQWITRD